MLGRTKDQHLFDQMSRSRTGFDQFVQIIRRLTLIEAPRMALQQVCKPEHGGQHIVEIMRHPTRQPANGLKLLRPC